MRRFPRGAIALVEPGYAHKEFVQQARPDYALIKYHHANRLLKAGEDADSWFPDETEVITTTSIRDNRNKTIPLEHNGHRRGEVNIVKQFKPDFHIPADRSDYLDYPDDYRFEKVKDCMVGTITVQNHIAHGGLDTQIIPLIKTGTKAERRLCYRTIDYLGLDHAAFYANPYFNGGDGVNIEELLDDIEYVAEESRVFRDVESPFNLITISCLSPNVLSRAHEAVVAGSGQIVGTDRAWRPSITPTTQSAETVETQYTAVADRVADALDVDDGNDTGRSDLTGENDTEQDSVDIEYSGA